MSILIKVAASRFVFTKPNYRVFEVEILDDGRMIFLNYNITHDQAALEFGYPETNATLLLKRWRDSPASVMWGRMDLPDEIYISLVNDYAEHVAYINKAHQDSLALPGQTYVYAMELAEEAKAIAVSVTEGKDLPGYGLETVARISATAAAIYAVPYPESPKDVEISEAAERAERDWQRRHFVELLEKFYGNKT